MNSNRQPNRLARTLGLIQPAACNAAATALPSPLSRQRLSLSVGHALGSRTREEARRTAGDRTAHGGTSWESAAFLALWAASLAGIAAAMWL